jgi:hypothetical protein
MDIRYRSKINPIIISANFNKQFRSMYNDFAKDIYFKINHKKPIEQSFIEQVLSGFHTKPVYYLSADYYMQIELSAENKQGLRDTIFCQLYPIITNSNTQQIDIMLRCILETLSKMILQMDVVTFYDLTNISFRDMLLASKSLLASKEFEDGHIQAMLLSLPIEHNRYQAEYESFVKNLAKSRTAIWKRMPDSKEEDYKRQIESDFVVSAVKMK